MAANARQVAWVSGSKPTGYTLRINTLDGRTLPFWSLHCTVFDDFKAAQSIANAIRSFCKAGGR